MTDRSSVREILSRLAALRRRIRTIFAVVGGARVVVAAAVAVVLFFVADRFLDLPMGVRRFVRLGLFDRPDGLAIFAWLPLLAIALFLAIALTRSRNGAAGLFAFIAGGIVGVVAWVAARAFAPLRVRLPDEDLALTVEERFDQLDDRLAAALDFERELEAPSRGESPEMMRRVVSEAVAEVEHLPVAAAVTPRRAVRWVGAAALALAAIFLGATAMPATASLWFRRSIQLEDVPWPRATTMVAVTVAPDGTYAPRDPARPYQVALGRPLVVHAHAQGEVPDEVFLVDIVEGQQPLARRMFSVPELPGVFAFEFRDVRRPFEFFVKGGDDEDEIPRHRVEITIPPRVLEIASTVSYPEYLGGETQRIASGTVTVPEGSSIDVAFSTDVPVAEAMLLMGDQTRKVPAVADGDGKSFRFSFEATSPTTYRLLLRTPEGRTNDATMDTYEVRVRRDRAPRIEWVYPRGTVEVTPEGRVPLLVRTTDDYAVTDMRLELRMGGEEMQSFPLVAHGTETTGDAIAANDGGYERTRVLSYVPIDLPDLRKADGSKVSTPGQLTFRFVATDSRGQLREGDWTFVDVYGPAELQRGLAGQRSAIRAQIVDLRAEQQARREELGNLLPGAIGPAEQDVIKTVRFSQGKIAQDADQAVRRLTSVFNGFVYDRLGATGPNEKILGYFDAHHRATYGVPPATTAEGSADGAWQGDAVFPYALYERIVAAWHEKLIYDRGLIDRMLAVIEDGVRIGAELAPAAQAAAATAQSGEAEDVRAAIAAQDAHIEALDELLDAMKSWQDLSDVTVTVRRLIDEQRTLDAEIEELNK